MKILADENIPYVGQAFDSLGQVKTIPGRLICNADLINTDILLVRSITQVNAELLKNTNIKFIASATSGIDHIHLNPINQKNIGFAHAKGSNALSVAQYVISGICYWSLLNNKSLSQLSLGIIGYGNVGKLLKKMAIQLGINCVINDPPLTDLGQKGLQELKSVLNSDIVSIHVPLKKYGKYPTNHLINCKNIIHLNPNGLFINTSRGGVVDENALIILKKNYPNFQIILDVWENEPNLNLEILSKTLLGTAHIAGYSIDGKLYGTEMIYHACCKFFKLKPKWNKEEVQVVDYPAFHLRTSNQNDILSSILQAYDILQDSKSLKKLLQHANINPIDYFDKLRKNYPIRRDWKGSLI